MFAHVTIHAEHVDVSERFYATVLGVLGHEPRRAATSMDWGEFRLAPSTPDVAVTRRLHIGFTAASRDQVDAFWHAGTDAGFRSNGEPGERTQHAPDYYGAFLLDPDGNSIEAVHYAGVNRSGIVDHVWLRVLDVPSAHTFYDELAAGADLEPGLHDEGYATFRLGSGGSLSLVAGNPTEAFHVGFAGSEPASMRDPDGNVIEVTSGYA